MRALVIGREEKLKLKQLIDHASKNILSMDDLIDTHNKEMAPVGDMDKFSCEIPNGYRVVYSLENQPKGLVRHISISVSEAGKLPSTQAVNMILEEIKFDGNINTCYVWIEDLEHGLQAINCAEMID